MTGRILVVDDEPNLQELLRIVLEGEGYSVRQAFNYRDATTLLAHQDFDLVVCDIVLPDGNGLDLLRTHLASKPDTRFKKTGPGQTPGFGRGDAPMPRNSPTLISLALWDQSITWDGTVFSETGTPGMSRIDGRIIAPVDTPPVRGMFTNWMLPRSDYLRYEEKFDAGMPISAGHGMFPAAVNAAMRGRAFGAFHLVQGIGMLAGSALFGLWYEHISRLGAFHLAGGIAAVAAVMAPLVPPRQAPSAASQ